MASSQKMVLIGNKKFELIIATSGTLDFNLKWFVHFSSKFTHVGVVDDATFLLEFEDYFYLIEIHLPRSVLRRVVNNNHAKHDAVFQVGILILW